PAREFSGHWVVSEHSQRRLPWLPKPPPMTKTRAMHALNSSSVVAVGKLRRTSANISSALDLPASTWRSISRIRSSALVMSLLTVCCCCAWAGADPRNASSRPPQPHAGATLQGLRICLYKLNACGFKRASPVVHDAELRIAAAINGPPHPQKQV